MGRYKKNNIKAKSGSNSGPFCLWVWTHSMELLGWSEKKERQNGNRCGPWWNSFISWGSFGIYLYTYFYVGQAGFNWILSSELGWHRLHMLVLLFSFFWLLHWWGCGIGAMPLLQHCVPAGMAHGTTVHNVWILSLLSSCVFFMPSHHNQICLQLYVWFTWC